MRLFFSAEYCRVPDWGLWADILCRSVGNGRFFVEKGALICADENLFVILPPFN